MDNQSQQKIDDGETDKKPLLASDTVSSVNNDSQMADLRSVQTPFSPVRFLIITIGDIFSRSSRHDFHLWRSIFAILSSGFIRRQHHGCVDFSYCIFLLS